MMEVMTLTGRLEEAPSGITHISYLTSPKFYDEIKLIVRGEAVSIPVVGGLDSGPYIQLCQVLQDVIKKYGGINEQD